MLEFRARVVLALLCIAGSSGLRAPVPSPAARAAQALSLAARAAPATTRKALLRVVAGACGATRAPRCGAAAPLLDVVRYGAYEGVRYVPEGAAAGAAPLLVVLHGAGENAGDARSLLDARGEHGGLAPALLAADRAPAALAETFVVAAPYSAGEPSFYGDSRGGLVAWVDRVIAATPAVDPRRVFLFGFSDGATVAVELLTTRRYAGGVVAAYGFTGDLPRRALDSLAGTPLWVVHAADDEVFDVGNSDRLVAALRRRGGGADIRFSRPKTLGGHAQTGAAAASRPDIYAWLSGLPPLEGSRQPT